MAPLFLSLSQLVLTSKAVVYILDPFALTQPRDSGSEREPSGSRPILHEAGKSGMVCAELQPLAKFETAMPSHTLSQPRHAPPCLNHYDLFWSCVGDAASYFGVAKATFVPRIKAVQWNDNAHVFGKDQMEGERLFRVRELADCKDYQHLRAINLAILASFMFSLHYEIVGVALRV